jgi:hypothetical protein
MMFDTTLVDTTLVEPSDNIELTEAATAFLWKANPKKCWDQFGQKQRNIRKRVALMRDALGHEAVVNKLHAILQPKALYEAGDVLFHGDKRGLAQFMSKSERGLAFYLTSCSSFSQGLTPDDAMLLEGVTPEKSISFDTYREDALRNIARLPNSFKGHQILRRMVGASLAFGGDEDGEERLASSNMIRRSPDGSERRLTIYGEAILDSGLPPFIAECLMDYLLLFVRHEKEGLLEHFGESDVRFFRALVKPAELPKRGSESVEGGIERPDHPWALSNWPVDMLLRAIHEISKKGGIWSVVGQDPQTFRTIFNGFAERVRRGWAGSCKVSLTPGLIPSLLQAEPTPESQWIVPKLARFLEDPRTLKALEYHINTTTVVRWRCDFQKHDFGWFLGNVIPVVAQNIRDLA